MMNYYDEIRNDIMGVLEEEEYKEIIKQSEDKDDAFYQLEDSFFIEDSITGNASGSYYFNSYKARLQCYNYFRNVEEALEEYGYNKDLQNFKTFVNLVEEGYLNIENMTLDYELLDEMEEDEKYNIIYLFEEIEGLDFETIDVITRCYLLSEVLSDVLDAML